MKKSTIWILTTIITLTFIALITVQVRYIKEIVSLKKEQFDESVQKALYQTSRNLELNETLRYLEADLNGTKGGGDSVASSTLYDSFRQKVNKSNPALLPKAMIVWHDNNSVADVTKHMQETIKERYLYQKAVVDELVYNIIYTASDKPLQERINFKLFDQDLRTELQNNGINLEYHYIISLQDGKEIYRCQDFSDDGRMYSYTEMLFRNDPGNKAGLVTVHFPEMGHYIYSSIRYMIPALVFTAVLIVIFFITVVLIFRQKKYNEMKNDFINNMTHELKTPISSISLAAQMLNDENVPKSPGMIRHLGGVVAEETKRLRYLVEKVLQMSLFEKQKAIFKKSELNLNELVEGIAGTFLLRVEHTGGEITPELEAEDAEVYVDETHFSNAIFNLFDNAIKYKHPDRPCNISVKSWNDSDNVYLVVSDNGMGIKREDQKKIFDQFYRVHTGNVHNVKGFGLGLAYVKTIIDLHGGTISVDSNKRGTSFKISLPLYKG